MKVRIPYKLDKQRVNNLMMKVIDESQFPKDQNITFDFSTLGFIEPAGITTLGNLFEWLIKHGTDTRIEYPEVFGRDRHCPIKYLDDSNFFLMFLGEKLEESSTVRNTTIPLQKVTYENSHQWLSATFIPWLASRLGIKISTLTNVEMCMGEIFNNIIDHSTENIGCIFAQHYPNKNKVTISIADFGVGIPVSIRRVNPDVNDALALELAIKEGFSSRSTPRNMGAGLHTLIQNVVNGLFGTVDLYSGYGILQTKRINDNISVTSGTTEGYYPGTFLDINFDTTILIEEDQYEEEEEFEW